MKKDNIKKLNKIVQKPTVTNLMLDEEENLFVFLSVDICNSTKMKNSIPNWFQVTQTLYNERFNVMHFWKYNGDEVLYAEPFSTIDNLIDTINQAYDYIKHMQNSLSAISEMPNFKLKGTIWIARTCGKIDDKFTKNLHIRINQTTNEFLGINIDEGFRLSEKVSGSKIVIDPKIVYLFLLSQDIYHAQKNFNVIDNKHPFHTFARDLSEDTLVLIKEILEDIYFINYTHLKGVWEERRYPVFWCYKDETNDFEYDEQLDGVYYKAEKLIKSELSTLIQGIFRSVNAETEFRKILALIASGKTTDTYSSESVSRLYYTIACVNPNTNNVLVFLRSKTRRHLKNIWEFGSFKHSSVLISESLEIKFKDTFGIEIEIITDGELEKNILPMHFCTIYRNGQAHNSILCFAKIKTTSLLNSDNEIIDQIKKCVNSDDYSDVKFVSKDDVCNYDSISLEQISDDSMDAISGRAQPFPDNTAVMYFKKSVTAAINFFSKGNSGERWYER